MRLHTTLAPHSFPPYPHNAAPTHSFKRGLLSEAALALEAEVQAQPGNADAWRLLGTVQAENDDDRQAIAALGVHMGDWLLGGCAGAVSGQ